uniref:Phosphodiesterase n=1 Tax=Cyprinus carpio TaxID=7962 RepID=A0A8C2EWI5_CYPCA
MSKYNISAFRSDVEFSLTLKLLLFVSFRLRCLVKQLDKGEVNVVDLRKNIEYAASVLEAVYIDETRRLLDTEDELSDIQADSVPMEVRDWLASTFTRKMGVVRRRPEEKPRFRSIVHAVQAGIFVERMYRRTSNMAGLTYSSSVITALKDVDKWSFDVFTLQEASSEHALKFLVYELLTRYDLISRFRIPVSSLVSFVEALEIGYSKHRNPYHNLIHAADVTQTAHYLMLHTGIMHWLSELEILAMVFAAAIHDFEHTGTTNNFHIQTRCTKSSRVLFVYVCKCECVIYGFIICLHRLQWILLLVFVMKCLYVTDEALMNVSIRIDKAKALSLMLHAADISHPAKGWKLHYRWTQALMEEFFRQGDKEAELGLPFSPLCDRKATMIAQSQIGFIDFIVEPTFSVLVDTTEKIISPLIEEAVKSGGVRRSSLTGRGSAAVVESVQRHSGRGSNDEQGGITDYSLGGIDLKRVQHLLSEIIQNNKERWKELSVKEYNPLADLTSCLLPELANKQHERMSDLEEEPMTNTQVTLSRSSPARGSHDSESKSLNELNNTDSTHSSQDSLDQSSQSPTERPGDGSPEEHSSQTLPWNGKSA